MKDHKPGPVLNARPGPRVLLQLDGSVVTQELGERLMKVVPTLAGSQSLSGYNLNEWDCLITKGATANVQTVHQSLSLIHI